MDTHPCSASPQCCCHRFQRDSAFAASLDAVPVTVTNESEPVLCAEKDNITIKVTSPEVRRFRIEAAHPPYIGGSGQG
jgi:hypothetical protein